MNIVQIFNVLSERARPADWEDQLAHHGLMTGDRVVIRDEVAYYDEDTAEGQSAKSLAPSFRDVVTPAEAVAIYDRVAALDELNFFHMDGCFLRDYRMSAEIFDQGVVPQKAWAVPLRIRDDLIVTYPDNSRASWSYHVAPVLSVRFGTGVEKVVLDPSLFDGPVRVAQWARVMGTDARGFAVTDYLTEPVFGVGSFKDAVGDEFKPVSRHGDRYIQREIRSMFRKKSQPSKLFTSDIRLMVEKPAKYAAVFGK